MRGIGAVAAAALVLSLTACGSLATAAPSLPPVTMVPATTPAPSVPPPPSTTPSSQESEPDAPAPNTAAADPGRPAGQCPDSSLGVSIRPSGDARIVVFTNVGGSACVLRGYPSVAVSTGDGGSRIGPVAGRSAGPTQALRLAVGASVTAALRITGTATLSGACDVVHGAGYSVTPPHSSRPYFWPDTTAVACRTGPVTLHVGPVVGD